MWFSDSKVVDSKGEPLVVYHGTNTKHITAFSKKHAGRQTGDPNAALGFYFTSSKKEALLYGPHIEEVYLSIQNPYYTTDEEIAGLDEESMDEFWEEIQDGNHDGIIADVVDIDARGKETGVRWFIAFEPTQVKSVDNLGEWSPTNPNIRHNPKEIEMDDNIGELAWTFIEHFWDPQDWGSSFALSDPGEIKRTLHRKFGCTQKEAQEVYEWMEERSAGRRPRFAENPAMTRGHFQLIARILRDNRPEDRYGDAGALWSQLVGEFAEMLSSTNPNFDRGRFLRAAGQR